MDIRHKSTALLYDTLIYVANNHNIDSVKSIENIYGSDLKKRNIKVIKKRKGFSTHTITNEAYKAFSSIDIIYTLHTSFLEVDLYIEFCQYELYNLTEDEMAIVEAITSSHRKL